VVRHLQEVESRVVQLKGFFQGNLDKLIYRHFFYISTFSVFLFSTFLLQTLLLQKLHIQTFHLQTFCQQTNKTNSVLHTYFLVPKACYWVGMSLIHTYSELHEKDYLNEVDFFAFLLLSLYVFLKDFRFTHYILLHVFV
jgi:hypothetical protein